MSWTAVIPTKGERHESLLPMVGVLGARNTVIIHTHPDSRHIAGATNIDDYGPVNIHRWWNRGIAASKDDYVAVLNDDLVIDHLTVPALAYVLDKTGATLAHHDTESHHYTGYEKPSGASVVRTRGWCWMVNRAHGILPDERFRWWFGDNDLALRALRDGKGIATAKHGTPVHLHPNRYTSASSVLQELAGQDKETYATLHA